MTKKATKKALVLSLFSLLLCFSMLLGTTFAWFTDSVTSAGNIIKSGTLDVTMEWAEGIADPAGANTVWTDASAGPIFENDLWEPGYTEARHIKIANVGTLALKYSIVIEATGEVEDLADVIDVYFIDPAAQVADRTALANLEPVGTLTDVLANMADLTAATLLAGEDATVTIVLKMQETAGNEYQDKQIGDEFAIKLIATQLTAENDSFDNMYDDIALVSDAASLKAAMANGGNIMLGADIAVDAPIAVADGVEASLDLNGHTISRVDADADKNDDGKFTSADNTCIFQVKGNLTVQGEGSIVMEHTGDNMEWNALSACFSVEAGELTLGEGVVVAHKGGTDMAYAVDVNTTLGETVLNINGATLYSPYVAVRVFNNHRTAKGIVNYNSGIVVGDNRDIWTQIMSAPAENAVVNTEFTYTTNANGDRYYFENDAAYVANAAGLNAALANGGEIVLLADIALDVADTGFTVARGVSAKIDLNGNDIIATSDSSESVQLFSVAGTLEIAGEGTISLNGDNFPWNSSYRYTAINIRETGVVTLGEGVNVVCEAGADSYGMSYAVDIYTTGVLNVNGASLHSNYIAVRCFFGDSVVNVTSGSITSSKNNWGIWPQSAPGAQINIASGIDYTTDSYGIYIFG